MQDKLDDDGLTPVQAVPDSPPLPLLPGARVLGLTVRTVQQLEEELRGGLSVVHARRLAERLELPTDELLTLIVGKRRARGGRLRTVPTRWLYTLAALYEQLWPLLGEGSARWLTRPNRALEHARPLDRALREGGSAYLLKLAERQLVMRAARDSSS